MTIGWLESLEGAGALKSAAQGFARRFLDDVAPSGPEGLRVLAARIDRFAETGAPEDEDAFLEGAGALLGSIVIAHHEGARHAERLGQHRVALGRAGFFDPFRVVVRLLDGDVAARRVLSAELSRIEADLTGQGPLSRLSLAFEAALREKRAELTVVDRFDSLLVLSDDTEVDLAQALRATEDLPVSVTPPPGVLLAAEKLVAMLPGAPLAEAYVEVDARLVPRLIGPGFPTGTGVHVVARCGELHVALVVLGKGRARFVQERDVLRWERAPEVLLQTALNNLARASTNVRAARVEPLLVLQSGDGLDSSRLLLPGLFETFTADLGGGDAFLAAVPHRDVLLLAPLSAADALRHRARDDCARAPHRISSAIHVVTADAVRPAPA